MSILALDVAGDAVGAVDRADREFLEGDGQVRVALDCGGNGLAPLEARLPGDGDPHQADGREADANDGGIGAAQPACRRLDAAGRGFELGQSGFRPATANWPGWPASPAVSPSAS
jgi:hypothetical protein